EPRDARYTPARLAALEDATVSRSDDGARALAQLSFLEEQLAETTDSLALMTVLGKSVQREETMTPVAKVERKPSGGWCALRSPTCPPRAAGRSRARSAPASVGANPRGAAARASTRASTSARRTAPRCA